MSITIENTEVEALLADLSAQTKQNGPDLVLDLLRRERKRLASDRDRRIAEGRAIDHALREHWNARAHIDPRAAGDILSFDENGLPE